MLKNTDGILTMADKESKVGTGRRELIIVITIAAILFCLYQFQAIIDYHTINDDVRVHYYPVYKLKDTSLFQDDIITDIFIYETPKLFLYLIYLLSFVIDIIILSKLLSFLVYLSTAYLSYKVASLYLRKPVRFLFPMLFLIQIWSYPSISGGLPRSLSYLLILSFIYFQATEQHLKKSVILISALLLYPPALFISWLAYAFLKLKDFIILLKKKRFTADLKYFMAITAILLISGNFLYSDAHENRFGKIADYEEVSTNIAFSEDGRINLYPVKPYYLLAYEYASPLVLISIFLLIPFIILNRKKVLQLPWEIWLILLSGFILHYAAGYTGLQLHWYTRFVRYTFPLVLVLFFSINIELVASRLRKKHRFYLFLIVLIIVGSAIAAGTTRNLMVCDKSDVYDFLSTTDKDSMTVGHLRDTPCIPLFSKRKVFTSREAISPAYSEYYEEVERRTMEFLSAYYSDNISDVRNFCKDNEIDYLLVDYIYLTNVNYSKVFLFEPFTSYVSNITEKKTEFALLDIREEKKIINNDKYFLLRCGDI